MADEHSPSAKPGDRVRDARRARGWSQRELAEQAGVSRPTVARIEADQHVLMATLEKVAEALEMTVLLGHQPNGT